MTRVIVCTSGKGGVGKTSLVSNLAVALTELKQNVIAIDANLTTPNLGLHLGMHLAPRTLHDVLKGEVQLNNAIYPHPLGFKILPSSMNIDSLRGVDAGKLPEVTLNLLGKADYILIDSSAGLGREAVSAIDAANEILIVTNPDLPSVADALRVAKIASSKNKEILGVVVNRVKREGHELTAKEIEYAIGSPVLVEIPEDKNVSESIASKMPIVGSDPNSPAAVEIRRLAHLICGELFKPKKPRFGIFRRLISWVSG
jgi:septum site-determining protein MinD